MTDIPAPSPGTVFTTWTAAPIADAAILFGTALYLLLVVRLRRSGQRWPAFRTTCWFAAVAALVVTVDSSMAVYAHALFWVHMLVHLVLIMVAPALLVWAQPIRLLHDAGGQRFVERLRHGRIFRVLTAARCTVPLYCAVIVLTHLTGFQQAMATHMWIHDAESAIYLLSGYLLLLPLAGAELTAEPPQPFLLRLMILGVCMGVDTLVGVTLMMSDAVLAPAYADMRNWGPSALTDQSAAGAIMWFGGDGLMMVLLVVIGGQWVAAGDRASSLGPWLDGIRRSATLGDETSIAADHLDDEQAALDAYNARLAALHGRPSPRPGTAAQPEADR